MNALLDQGKNLALSTLDKMRHGEHKEHREHRGRNIAIVTVFVLSASSVFSVAPGQSRTATEREARTSYRDEYGVLSDRNMFLRDRRKPATTSPTSRPAEKPPEQTFMLTGVVYEPLEGKAFAYFEDLNANTILRVGVGEKVARGIVAGIDINAVSYERDGKYTSVLVGEDLTGAKASLGTPSSVAAEAASPGGTSVPAIDPNNPNLTTEQRMRLRRQQERR